MKNKNSELQIGIIGAGGRGAHLGTLAHRPGRGARIVACCDVSPATLARNRQAYGAGIFTTSNYRELLTRDLDAVIVATPDFLHEDQAVAVVERGLAIYLEKPMALTIAGCDRILRAAAKARARLYVGHNMRHMPFVRKMKALIDDGAIGEVKACWVRHFVGHGGDFYFRDWHAERRYTTSLLLQKAAHDLDIIHWLSGGYSRKVSALGGLTLFGDLPRKPKSKGLSINRPGDMKLETFPYTRMRGFNPRIDVEDLSTVQMQLDNGVFATYAQCMYTPDYWRNYMVIGTEGRMENFGNGEAGTHVRVWNRRKQGYDGRGDAIYRLPVARGTHGGADPMIMAEFLRFAQHGGKTDTSPIAARESVATGCMATESLRAGGEVRTVPRVPTNLLKHFRA